MDASVDEVAVNETVARIEALIERAGDSSGELAAALMQLYGAGLARITAVLQESAPAALDRLAADKLVGSLLLLHDLHPVDVETRLRRALDRVERGLESYTLSIAEIADGIAHIRVEGSGAARPGLARAIEAELEQHVPDLARVEIENVAREPLGQLVQIAPAAGRV